MARKKRVSRSHGPGAIASGATAAPRDRLRAIARGALVLALLCIGLAVDTGVGPDAAFDAPKRLSSLLLAGVAAAALAFSSRRPLPPGKRQTLPQRWTLFLLAGTLAWSLLSALLSPRSSMSLEAIRTILLFSIYLLLGASRALDGRKGWLLAAFLGVLALNAAVSILQARGLFQPFALDAAAESRLSTGAYVGNVGYLAQALALGSIAALGLLLGPGRPAVRFLAGGASLLFFGALLGNRTLTSFSALLAGAAILCLLLPGRRAILPAAGALLLLAIVVLAYRPMHRRVMGAVHAAQAGDWNLAVTYRVGAWRAALAMTGDRPLFGYGPGTFGAEYAPHRLAAEIASRRRFENPFLMSTYAEAHCDYLQLFAEGGIPAGVAAVGAALFLFLGLAQKIRRSQGVDRNEPILLLAFLGAGAIAALTWFPLQRPITAVPLLLAAGRAWRICGRSERNEPLGGLRLRMVSGSLAILVLLFLLRPEWSRYVAERRLGLAQRGLQSLLSYPADAADRQGGLHRISELVEPAVPDLPSDPRPWTFLGNLRILSGEPDRALGNYRKALALGERPDTDLHLARAYEALGQTEKAWQAYVRGIWVSPPFLQFLSPEMAAPVSAEIARLEEQLRAGQLHAPPPLP